MPSSSRICAHTQNNITNETTMMIRKQKRFAKLVRLDTQNVDFHDVCLSVSGELLLSMLLVLPNSRALQKNPLLLHTQEEREDRKWVAVWWPWSRRRETSFSPNPNPRVRIAFVWDALFLYSTSKIALLERESSSWEWRSRSSRQPTTPTTSSSVRRVPRQAIFCRCDFPFSYIFRYGEKESREVWFWVRDLLLCFHLKIVDVFPLQADYLLACCSALFAEKHSGL